jgi:boron transporter
MFSGVRLNLTQRRPLYYDDWVPSRSDIPKVISATVFIFFSNIIPAIAFAFMLAIRTNNALGVIETVFSMALGGLIFSIFAGQPLVIVGVTGPVSIFCAIVHDLSKRFDIAFIPWLFFISLWTCLFNILLSAFSMSTYFVGLISPFSGDIFGALICVIYLIEGVYNFSSAFACNHSPVNVTAIASSEACGDRQQSSAVLALFLGLLCAVLANTLGKARKWTILPSSFTVQLADYAMPISVVLLTSLQFLPAFRGITLSRLGDYIPNSFSPSYPRSWLTIANLDGLPTWAIFAAFIPAAVLTSLLYFDHNISSSLSQQAHFGLKKPPSYDWDFLLLGISVAICGALGLPPNYGLIPQAPLHVRSLATIVEVREGDSAPVKETWTKVVETRWSAFGQSLLTISLLSHPLLALVGLIPKGVLAGLFVYLGLQGIQGNGILARIHVLWLGLVGQSGYPSNTRAAFTFTCIEVVLVGIIYAITITPAGVCFPVLIVLLIPLRLFALPRLFGPATIQTLDPLSTSSPTASLSSQTGLQVFAPSANSRHTESKPLFDPSFDVSDLSEEKL